MAAEDRQVREITANSSDARNAEMPRSLAYRFNLSNVTLECSLPYNFSGDKGAYARDFTERRETVNVSWWARPHAFQTIGVWEMF